MGGIFSKIGGALGIAKPAQQTDPGAAMQSGPSPAQLQMALSMLGNVAQGAQGSGSPLLSFLAPLATGYLAPKIQGKIDTAKAQKAAQLSEGLLGPQSTSPTAQAAMDVLNSQDAPDYLKTIAQTMLKSAVKGGGGTGGRHSGGGSSKAGGRVYGAQWVLNPQSGAMEYWGHDGAGNPKPMLNPQGQVWSKPAQGSVLGSAPAGPSAPPAPQLPPQPALPADPASPLLPDDPLGIRQ